MAFLSEEDVISIYAATIGPPVLRSRDGLASALANPQQSAFGQDAYPTTILKAAALMRSLAQNQPFLDGNKRIAWICGKLFLQMHGLTMEATIEDGLDFFCHRVASGMSVEELGVWISERGSRYAGPT